MKGKKTNGNGFAAIMAGVLVFVMLLDVVLYSTGMVSFLGS